MDDWGRFFPATPPGADIGMTGRVAAGDTPDPSVRLQFAYKIDPSLVDPLAALPVGVPEADAMTQAEEAIAPTVLPNKPRLSLALLNLLRGNSYGIATGQNVARALHDAGKPVQH